jgi:hypothetical protein
MVAGYSITVRAGRIYLVDQHPDRGDPRISPAEAKELAQRLIHAAAVAERDQRNRQGRHAS